MELHVWVNDGGFNHPEWLKIKPLTVVEDHNTPTITKDNNATMRTFMSQQKQLLSFPEAGMQ